MWWEILKSSREEAYAKFVEEFGPGVDLKSLESREVSEKTMDLIGGDWTITLIGNELYISSRKYNEYLAFVKGIFQEEYPKRYKEIEDLLVELILESSPNLIYRGTASNLAESLQTLLRFVLSAADGAAGRPPVPRKTYEFLQQIFNPRTLNFGAQLFRRLLGIVEQLHRGNITGAFLQRVNELIVDRIYNNFIMNSAYFRQDNLDRESFYLKLSEYFYMVLSSNLKLSNDGFNYKFTYEGEKEIHNLIGLFQIHEHRIL